MKKILGLDLGTNSIGWAVVNAEEANRENETSFLKPIGIDAAGSRIIPMDAAILGDFDKGNSVSQTKERTSFRGIRRLRERCLLRRERLHRVLKLLDFLPEHFAKELNRYGKFTTDSEPKIAWKKNAEGKFEFVFEGSFLEMIEDFRKNQPELVSKKNNGKDNKKVPYDWTIYYLRKKALTQPITKEELAWILLNFNQKRGYYQLRGEDEEEKSNKKVEFHALKVVAVEDSGEKKGNETWYNVHLENGWIYRRTSNIPLDWVGKIKEFIVTTDVNDDGTPKTDKDGNEKRSFRAPKEDDWTLLKKKTETEIYASHKTVGEFIYDSILANPNQKIIGKLIRTIERKFYKDELRQILEKQKEFHAELRDEKLYAACCEELYASNEAYRNSISNRDFTYLFLDDIIFYQRPLKSKKSLIANCPYESRFDKNGEEHSVKCIAKSNPLFQEFRLWQFVQNLRIYQREKTVQDNQLDLFGEPSAQKLQVDVDITAELFTSYEDYVKLFDWLNDKKSIQQETLIHSYFKKEKDKYRWNYVEDKEYPCNETRAELLSGLKKCGIAASFLTHEQEMALWHILYSVEDKIEIEKALKKFADKRSLPESFAEVFSKIKPFKKDYGSYSEKAIKKLLSLMRMGKYWNYENIDTNTKDRIQKIITGEYDEKIRNRVRDLSINLIEESDFQGLPMWLACYIVYDRHSEAKEIQKWEKPEDIDKYLQEFKQHSLRNPIVEQVITETLRTVRDIWKQVGKIDEIHVELGREMKNPADKRKKMTENIQKNENTNLRIKAMLAEFANPEFGIENVRPYSPSQQDILRIYEENALENLSDKDKDFEFVSKISKSAQPTKSDIIRYKAWLEQQYRSPYTGKMIPLAKLFTAAYEIEHVIPQSRYFDDSFSNKVICEAEVNKLKDNQLGFEFIKNHHGEKVQMSGGGAVEILSVDAYEKFVKDHYSHNNVKKKKLLMEDIPEDFIARQLNDSRYISKVVKGLLSNIVRTKDANGAYEQEATSRNLISCTGGITDRLKLDWGMNDVWNRIILPRFERLNQLTGKDCFTTLSKEGHWIPNMPLELQKGFNKKRIDHRHHAMDAIVIACTTCRHVQYLNNENAKSNNYEVQRGLAKVLCSFKDVEYHKKEKNEKGVWVTSEEVVKKTVPDKLLKPWDSFTQDAQNVLQNIIVSFKQNLRVINKTTNYYQHYDKSGKKVLLRQEKGDSWAIRKPMHKETVFGEINLRMKKPVSLKDALKNPKAIVEKDLKKKILELLADGKDVKAIKKYFEDNKDVWSDVNLSKIDVYYFTQDIKNKHGEVKERYFATRKSLDTSFDKKKIETSIADTGIQKILLAHLESKGGDPELAFSPDGIDEMNRNIKELNGGKNHQPILKVRVYEKADKFAIGTKGNKSKKFVEAAKGTNLFFAIFESIETDNNSGEEVKVRSYATVPLNMVIDCQKEAGKNWKEKIDSLLKEKEMVVNDARLLFMLSPNDLVYLPTEDQIKNGIDAIDRTRIYKMVSCTGNRLYAIPYAVANTIVDKIEFSQLNKIEFSDEKLSIKTTCIPLKVDRLGNIVEVNGIKL